MFDQSQLVKLVSALNTVLEQNKTDLDNFSSDTHIKGPIKSALNDKMRALQSAASVAVTALKQLQEVKQDKEKLIDANKNLKDDLFNLCDVNIQLQDEMSKLKDQVDLQKEQLKTAEKTQEILEKQKEQIQNLFQQQLKKDQLKIISERSNDTENESKIDAIESEANTAWKEKYNNNVSHIKKQLQQLRKATTDLRQKISQNQNRIRKTLKSKKSRDQLLQVYGSLDPSNDGLKKETAKKNIYNFKKQKCTFCHDMDKNQCNRCTQVSEQTQEQSQMSTSRVRKLSSFDQNILNELVEGLLIKEKKQQEVKQSQKISFFDKMINRTKDIHEFLFQKIVKDRIKTGIRETMPIGKRRRLNQLQLQA